ncbi:MAG: helix-hairpin-helix domain-containing protein [Saprospiraceae bacterium]|nr:helix-hairpin-helix domain-containing protein [Saprospiraceae bacterium]
MKNKKNIKLPLTPAEKANLRKNNIKLADVHTFTADELEVLLKATPRRAREIRALAEFQTVPSIGIRFAEDLVFMGYYALKELKNKDGARLTEEYERKKAYWIDPCVEDQFRLVVYFANTCDASKSWWDFAPERKKYRSENGYPADRPQKAWYETLGTGRKAPDTC